MDLEEEKGGSLVREIEGGAFKQQQTRDLTGAICYDNFCLSLAGVLCDSTVPEGHHLGSEQKNAKTLGEEENQ